MVVHKSKTTFLLRVAGKRDRRNDVSVHSGDLKKHWITMIFNDFHEI